MRQLKGGIKGFRTSRKWEGVFVGEGLNTRLRAARFAMNMTQGEFAVLGNVSRVSQHLYEAGKRCPDSAYLLALREHGIDILWILTGDHGVDSKTWQGVAVEAFVALDLLERELIEGLAPTSERVRKFMSLLVELPQSERNPSPAARRGPRVGVRRPHGNA